MCIAIPGRVVAVGEQTAEVERYGERLTVSLLLLPEPVEVGDYVTIQARAHAVAKISPGEAQEIYRLFDAFMEVEETRYEASTRAQNSPADRSF